MAEDKSPFGSTPIQAGILGIGSGLVDNVANQIFGEINQKRQIRGSKELMDYQQQKALEMWEKTGYGAQRKQMEAAGINPALLYGMSGGGGQTAGNVSGAMPTSPGVSKGMDIAGATQLALIQAQIENVKADTQDKLANIPGKQKDPALKESATNLNTELAKTEKGKQASIALQNEYQKILNRIKDLTQWNEVGIVEEQFQKLAQEARSAGAKASVDAATVENDIKMKAAQLAGQYLQNVVTKAQPGLIKEMTETHNTNQDQMFTQMQQGWGKFQTDYQNASENQQKGMHDRFINNMQETWKMPIETAEKFFQILTIGGALKQMQTPKGNNPTSAGKPWIINY